MNAEIILLISSKHYIFHVSIWYFTSCERDEFHHHNSSRSDRNRSRMSGKDENNVALDISFIFQCAGISTGVVA